MSSDKAGTVESFVRKWWAQIMALVALVAWIVALDKQVDANTGAISANTKALVKLNETTLPNLTEKVDSLALAVNRLATLEEARSGK